MMQMSLCLFILLIHNIISLDSGKSSAFGSPTPKRRTKLRYQKGFARVGSAFGEKCFLPSHIIPCEPVGDCQAVAHCNDTITDYYAIGDDFTVIHPTGFSEIETYIPGNNFVDCGTSTSSCADSCSQLSEVGTKKCCGSNSFCSLYSCSDCDSSCVCDLYSINTTWNVFDGSAWHSSQGPIRKGMIQVQFPAQTLTRQDNFGIVPRIKQARPGVKFWDIAHEVRVLVLLRGEIFCDLLINGSGEKFCPSVIDKSEVDGGEVRIVHGSALMPMVEHSLSRSTYNNCDFRTCSYCIETLTNSECNDGLEKEVFKLAKATLGILVTILVLIVVVGLFSLYKAGYLTWNRVIATTRYAVFGIFIPVIYAYYGIRAAMYKVQFLWKARTDETTATAELEKRRHKVQKQVKFARDIIRPTRPSFALACLALSKLAIAELVIKQNLTDFQCDNFFNMVSQTENCVNDGDSTTCSVKTNAQLSFAGLGSTNCLNLLDAATGKNVGQLAVQMRRVVRNYGLSKAYRTRGWKLNTGVSKRCWKKGPCDTGSCESVNGYDDNPMGELDAWMSYYGYSSCLSMPGRVVNGCATVKDACGYYRWYLEDSGEDYDVSTIGASTDEVDIYTSVGDQWSSNSDVKIQLLALSPITEPNVANQKVITEVKTGRSWIHEASEPNVPQPDNVGDLQIPFDCTLMQLCRNKVVFHNDVVCAVTGGQSVTCSTASPGIKLLESLNDISCGYNGFTTVVTPGKLTFDLPESIALVGVSFSDSVKVQFQSNKVCPEGNLISVDQLFYQSERPVIIFLELKSRCLSGLVTLSVDDPSVSLRTGSLILSEQPGTFQVQLFPSKAENDFSILIHGSELEDDLRIPVKFTAVEDEVLNGNLEGDSSWGMSNNKREGMSGWSIFGISLGSIFGFILLVIVFVILWKLCSKCLSKKSHSN